MMETYAVSEDEVYEICNKHFTNIGLPLVPAKGTPLKLSYIWKHVKRLTAKFIEWDFTLDEINAYLRIVATRIKKLPPRQQSLQNAIKNDMLEFCYRELKRESELNTDLVSKLRSIHQWFNSVAGSDRQSQILHLTRRHKPGALPNIVVYYQQGRLNKQYIAFSSVCREALNTIGSQSQTERSFCPSDAALQYMTQYQYKNQTHVFRNILEQ